MLLLITAGLALLLALPLALRREPDRSELFLAAFVATQGISALCFVMLYNPVLRPHTLALTHPLQNLPLVLMYLLQGLLLLGYSHAMAGRPLRLDRADTGMLILWLFLTLGNVLGYLINPDHPGAPMVGMFEGFQGLVLSVYFGLKAIWVLRCYQRDIRQHYSNIDDINLRWLNIAVFGFVGVWFLRLISYLPLLIPEIASPNLLGMISNYPSVLLISWMVVLGLRQGSRSVKDVDRNGEARDARREADPGQVHKLEDLMNRVRLYQDPELDLDGLADSMGLSARSLSALINGHYSKNFYDFVNGFRIEAVKQQLADPEQQDKSIQRIFEDAGFNSKSTFNTLFKRATGMTPSAYRRDALKKAPADPRLPVAQ